MSIGYNIVDERNEWARNPRELADNYYLNQYKFNRGDPFWRSTRELEKLCEYVLYLERLVDVK